MIETPADYRSFIFCEANKTPVCSQKLGFPEFYFYIILALDCLNKNYLCANYASRVNLEEKTTLTNFGFEIMLKQSSLNSYNK